MKIQLATGSVSRLSGGLFESVRHLGRHLHACPGWEVQVVGTEDRFTNEDMPAWLPLKPRLVRPRGPRRFAFSPDWERWFRGFRPEVIHLQFLWTYASVAARRWSDRNAVPVVVSPRGMLDPWALRNSGWRKRLAWRLFEARSLAKARCLHALADSERKSIRRCGFKGAVAVVPNGVDVHPAVHGAPQESRVLTYIGRLNRKKNLTSLVEAVHILRRSTGLGQPPWRLLIAGWDDGAHEKDLRAQCGRLGLDGIVNFVGPVMGEAKQEILRASGAFVLPSLSEGLPIAVLEAWAHGLPVLMTEACNLPEGFANGAAIHLEPDAAGIAVALRDLISMPRVRREQIGHQGRQLVIKRFSWGVVTDQMRSVFDWICHGGAAPQFVEAA